VPFQPESVRYQGWLQKEGHFRRNWRSRYFVLLSSELVYYVDDKYSSLKGSIKLRPTTGECGGDELMMVGVVVGGVVVVSVVVEGGEGENSEDDAAAPADAGDDDNVYSREQGGRSGQSGRFSSQSVHRGDPGGQDVLTAGKGGGYRDPFQLVFL
jgi:hypothetical protein